MFRCRNSIACCLFCTVAPLACGAETINHPGPYRPWSAEIQQTNPELLYGLNEVAYAKMTLDDPLLKLAYIDVFTRAVGNFLDLDPPQALALADMRRRGEAITPMLLKLADENQETVFEIRLLCMVDQVGTIRLDPYLEYARNLLRERTQTMSSSAAGVASQLLAGHGSMADADLLRQVLEQRPYVADDVTRDLGMLEKRLNSTPQNARPSLRERPAANQAATNRAANGKQKPSSTADGWQSPTSSWIVWVLLIASVSGVLWILLKKCIRR